MIACNECHGMGEFVSHGPEIEGYNSATHPFPKEHHEVCPRCKGEAIEFCHFHPERPAEFKEPDTDYMCFECAQEFKSEVKEHRLYDELLKHMPKKDADKVWRDFEIRYPNPGEMHARLAIRLALMVVGNTSRFNGSES
jgi:hypothetical protein